MDEQQDRRRNLTWQVLAGAIDCIIIITTVMKWATRKGIMTAVRYC